MKSSPPDPDCLFVDPAGLNFIQRVGPSGAGGASGSIYRHIGIHDAGTFPLKVRMNVRAVGDAYWYVYNRIYNCCHVVGPNFTMMVPPPTKTQAIDLLARVYKNIFRQFARSRLTHLRLLPVSGGIYSGQFQSIMPELTFVAINQAFRKLSDSDFQFIQHHKDCIKMCIFEEIQASAFQKASKAFPTDL
jgi:hypothetical protein